MSITLKMIWVLVAPKDLAASMMPASTVSSDPSMILAANGVAAMVSGTIAAVVPMDVPTMSLDNGNRRNIRMINGKLLNTLMIKSSMLYRAGFGFNPFSFV